MAAIETDSSDDLRALRALPRYAPDPELVSRVRTRALEAQGLTTGQRLRKQLWGQFIVPVALTGIVGVYLIWAVDFVSRLYR